MDYLDAAMGMAGRSRLEGAEARDVTNAHAVRGTAMADSSDGTVLVDLGGDVTTGDGSQWVEVRTDAHVLEGDQVDVLLVGQSGRAMSPTVFGVPGGGDRMQASIGNAEALATAAEAVAQATGQHFWHADDGAHVTQVTREEWEDPDSPNHQSGPNSLWNSLGMLFRDGLTNLLAVLTSGIAIYDGEGNDDGNIIAEFSANKVRLGGKFADSGTSTAKVQFFEDTSALTDLTAEHYVDTETEPKVSHDFALSSTITDEDLPDGTGRTVTGNVELWQQVCHEDSEYSDQSEASLNAMTTSRQYASSVGVRVLESTGNVFSRILYGVADTLRLTCGTGTQASTTDFDMAQVVDELTEGSGTLSYASGFKAYQDDSARLPKWRRSGNVVSIRGAATPTSQIAANNATTMFTLPTAIRPSENIFGPRMQGSGMNSWYMAINANGTVQVERYGTTSNAAIPAGAWLPFFATYIID